MVSSSRTSTFSRHRFGETTHSPRRKLTILALLTAASIVISPLISPASVIQTTFGSQEDVGSTLAIDSPTFTPESIAMTEDGFILKTSTQTAAVDRSEFADILTYTVESGDTLSTIAHRFGVSTDTIVWANDIANPARLKVGTALRILPVSGVAHTTGKGDTLAGLAKKYGVETEKIAKQNHLTTDAKLIAGMNLIIPGARKMIETTPTYIAAAKKGSYASYRKPTSFDGAIVTTNAEKDKAGKWMIKPTNGLYTTYFRPGHWAVDIANRASPNVDAAAAGTVVQSQCGWNGGYGCMVLIDHGDGFQTLYGHLAKLYVSVGEKVEKGASIAKMGHTGNVHGPTGIHLHFEVVKNGRKVNPLAYYAE